MKHSSKSSSRGGHPSAGESRREPPTRRIPGLRSSALSEISHARPYLCGTPRDRRFIGPFVRNQTVVGLQLLFEPLASMAVLRPASRTPSQTLIPMCPCPTYRRSMSHSLHFWLSLNSAPSYSASSPH